LVSRDAAGASLEISIKSEISRPVSLFDRLFAARCVELNITARQCIYGRVSVRQADAERVGASRFSVVSHIHEISSGNAIDVTGPLDVA
jgi:hypothetical protein